MTKRPDLYMLVGLPGSGKSTWVNHHHNNHPQMVVLSTDNYIEQVSEMRDQTYNEVFNEVFDRAESALEDDLRIAVEDEQDIIWDQTNLTVKTRRRKLAKIPDSYRKIAVIFTTSEDTLNRRLACRTGKGISNNVIKSMRDSYVRPDYSEGFGTIMEIYN